MKKKLLIATAVITLFTVTLVGCSKTAPSSSPPMTGPPPAPVSSTPLAPPLPPPSSPSSPAEENNNGSAPATLQEGLPLKVTDPADAATLTTGTVLVKGQTEPGATVNVNDEVGAADDQGYFSIPISLEDGPFAIDVIATNTNGNQSEVLLLENVDLSQTQASAVPNQSSLASTAGSMSTIPLKITAPVDGADISTDIVTVQGRTTPEATVSVNDQVDMADNSGNFSITINLVAGANAIDVTATDEDGNQNEETLMVNAGTGS